MAKVEKIRFLAVIFALLLCWGCGGMSFGPKPEASSTEVFGPMPAEQLLKMAEDRFKAGDYLAAMRAYDAFEKDHPGSQLMPFCVFGRGLSYMHEMETIDRDQAMCRKAAEQFQRVTDRYPGWKYTADAKAHLKKCRGNLAEHEFYVGSYYQRTGRYRAALIRYQGLVRDYPEFTKGAEVKKGIAECEAELAKAPKPKGLIAQLFDAQW
jgi:outer membrane protein assembly factor BamD